MPTFTAYLDSMNKAKTKERSPFSFDFVYCFGRLIAFFCHSSLQLLSANPKENLFMQTFYLW
ncbi:CLUMA_CG003695, isoform A [Clunio marinus]|uniref:CLUMA_CG003695, isoform A n=1 Tax=Clunio marinus TaxID=568069 RepID=A0A1J1HPJ5_9DIPT|nr:CLUMA_CG003695, isoform A [Clunio marinus]